MQILQKLDKSQNHPPAAITIGNFDGLHLGHQAVLKKLKDVAIHKSCKTSVITFSNHPLEVLKPELILSHIHSVEHKIRLLEKYGIDQLILLPFTLELANLSADEFLDCIQEAIPYKHLILGYDARFGKNKSGDRANIEDYSKKHHIAVEYIPPFSLEGTIVSSSKIRHLIHEGNLKEAEHYLGRPFSYFVKLAPLIDLSGLCTPPLGSYSIQAIMETPNGNQTLQGIARIDYCSMQVDFKEFFGCKAEIVILTK